MSCEGCSLHTVSFLPCAPCHNRQHCKRLCRPSHRWKGRDGLLLNYRITESLRHEARNWAFGVLVGVRLDKHFLMSAFFPTLFSMRFNTRAIASWEVMPVGSCVVRAPLSGPPSALPHYSTRDICLTDGTRSRLSGQSAGADPGSSRQTLSLVCAPCRVLR